MGATSLDRLPLTYNGLTLNETSALTPTNKSWYKVDSFQIDFLDVRNVQDARALEDGIEDYDSYIGMREISIGGMIVAETVSAMNYYAQQLRQAFNPRLAQSISANQQGYLPFNWSETISANTYTMRVEAKSSKMAEINPYLEEFGGLVAPFKLFLKAKDPRKYNDTQTSGTLTSGTTSVAVVNNGDYPTYPTFTVTGPVSTFTITNQTTGEYLTVSTTLSSGQAVSVSMYDRRISGSSNYYQYKSSGSNFPFYVSAGNVTLAYSALSVSSSTCAYSFRDSWI